MLLLVTSRGRHFACLERILNIDGSYRWETVGTERFGRFPKRLQGTVANRARLNEDLWAIELDIADPEQFIGVG